MFFDNGAESSLDLRKRFVPRCFLPALGGSDSGRRKPVRVFVKLLECGPLGTDETLGVWIVHVTTDTHDLITLGGDFEPAACFAEWAGTVMRRCGIGGFSSHGATVCDNASGHVLEVNRPIDSGPDPATKRTPGSAPRLSCYNYINNAEFGRLAHHFWALNRDCHTPLS